jgi:D-amino-acid dehydrogenase
MLFVYDSSESRTKSESAFSLARRHGVTVELLSGEEARELNPALGSRVRSAALFPGNGHTPNPLRLSQTLARHFVSTGGTLLREFVRDILPGDRTLPSVVTDNRAIAANIVVLAAGVWSRPFARRLGCEVPLESERGYHKMLPHPNVAVTLPTTLSDRNVVLTPMEHGLRITGIAEFAGVEHPPRMHRADVLVDQAREFLPKLSSVGAQSWMGHRPSTPDSLPVIGAAPADHRILFAFGHGQAGLAMSAITGRLIAELAARRRPSVDIAPFAPDRFRRNRGS